MERSVDSLTYKGSVTDAIVEAQWQKKLFLVYISGEDENSTHLELSTWLDDKLNPYQDIASSCICGREASMHYNFLPYCFKNSQKKRSGRVLRPLRRLGGRSGMFRRLRQHRNFFRKHREGLGSTPFSETAVTLLTAALASNKPEPLNSSSQDVAQGNTAALDIASTSAVKSIESLGDRPSNDSKLPGKQMVGEPIDDQKGTGPSLETSSQGIVDDVKMIAEQTNSESNTKGEVLYNVTRDVHNPSTCNVVDVSVAPKETLAFDESCIDPSAVLAGEAVVLNPISSQITATVKDEKAKNDEVAELINCSTAMKSDDINFNIRLPNGASLQRRFMIADTLRSVKTYVDENQSSAIGSYDLAVPYPQKVFNEQDMNSVLSELGFATRQALIVVPHHQVTRPQRGMSSSLTGTQNSARMIQSTNDNGGYFAFVKRVLSYINPLSYLGGNANSSNSEPTPSDSYQQYRLNQAFQSRQLPGAETSRQNPSTGGSVGEMRTTTRPFGSNIHTLRHDEDDFQSRDRNMFWNGNSTQFGGDNKK